MDKEKHARLTAEAAETRAVADFWRSTGAAEPFRAHLADLNKRLDGDRADLETCEPKDLIRTQANIRALRAVLAEFRTIADSRASDARNAAAALAKFEADNGLFLAAERAESGAGNVIQAVADRINAGELDEGAVTVRATVPGGRRAMAPDPDVLYEDAGNGIPTEAPAERPKRKARASA